MKVVVVKMVLTAVVNSQNLTKTVIKFSYLCKLIWHHP